VIVHAVLHREYAVLVLAGRVDELYDVVLRFDTLDLREGCKWELQIITSRLQSIDSDGGILASGESGWDGALTVLDGGVIGVHELAFHELYAERRFACR